MSQKSQMLFPQAKTYLDSFINYEFDLSKVSFDSLRIDRVQELLKLLGNPQNNFKIIHVAGSKGKGSTTALIASILKEAGYKVGLYTSPHIDSFRERIRVLDYHSETLSSEIFPDAISEEDICLSVQELKPAIEDYLSRKKSIQGTVAKCADARHCRTNAEASPSDVAQVSEAITPQMRVSQQSLQLSFFEVYTVLALYYFFKKKVDFAVLETGLGGRFDSTNAASSLVAAITPISLEHTNILGDNMCDIAREKAAIIKDGTKAAVIAQQQKDVEEILLKHCKEFSINPDVVGKNIYYESVEQYLDKQVFNVKGRVNKYLNLKMSLTGKHQAHNAAVAISVVESLNNLGFEVSKVAVFKGIEKCFWPVRFEIFNSNPMIILDGAHSQASCVALVNTIKDLLPLKNIVVVLGISKDKDRVSICQQLNEIAAKIIFTKADHPRASEMTKEDLEQLFPQKECFITANVSDALSLARQKAGINDVILVTGSLFVAGEMRRKIKDRE